MTRLLSRRLTVTASRARPDAPAEEFGSLKLAADNAAPVVLSRAVQASK
jgi:hypothetical protein